jgi:hypothetical protein
LADEKAGLMAAWKAEKMDAAKAAVLADGSLDGSTVGCAEGEYNGCFDGSDKGCKMFAKFDKFLLWMQEEVMNLDISKDLPVHLVE